MARIHRWTVQKRFNDSDNHDGVITHLEPDILESEVKWVLGSISMWALGSSTKLVEVIEFQWAIADPKRICCWSAALNMPENLENSAVPVIGLEKVSFHSNPKECSNYCTLELIYILARSWSKSFKLGFISRWSKNFQTFQMDLEDRGTRDQIVNIHWIRESKENLSRIYNCFIDYTKAFDGVDHNNLWKILKEME